MKKILYSAVVFCSFVVANAQLAIGKQSVTNGDVSLEFAETENKELILPYLEDKSGIIENGTHIYDIEDHKVKYLKDGAWFDLSIDNNGEVALSIQETKTENTNAKTAIGTNGEADATSGILVLTDMDKSMIIPKVASPLNIINPSAGIEVYDTVKKQLAVYNGTVWSSGSLKRSDVNSPWKAGIIHS